MTRSLCRLNRTGKLHLSQRLNSELVTLRITELVSESGAFRHWQPGAWQAARRWSGRGSPAAILEIGPAALASQTRSQSETRNPSHSSFSRCSGCPVTQDHLSRIRRAGIVTAGALANLRLMLSQFKFDDFDDCWFY